jgi:hypothetical protein
MVGRLCPKWLEEMVNEDEEEDGSLDEEMGLRFIEDVPLVPLSPELVSVEREGVEDLSREEISAMEALFCNLDMPKSASSPALL